MLVAFQSYSAGLAHRWGDVADTHIRILGLFDDSGAQSYEYAFKLMRPKGEEVGH